MSGHTRLYAILHARVLHPRVRHVVGLPPELTEGVDESKPLPRPDVLVIEKSQGGVFLYRMTRNGEPAGDTWHESVEDAKSQSEYEYSLASEEWKEVPEEAPDAIDFAVAAVRSHGEGDR